ncbi:hypothetical protein ACFVKB_46705 [Rhodococcus sp. NPDC127530]|uniref:hypothetical protein n=1 Tax=unclassified Rhodococcus (in: high G+C Gram-positive bacteria) TaxID=192944 RepID=UPI00364405EA
MGIADQHHAHRSRGSANRDVDRVPEFLLARQFTEPAVAAIINNVFSAFTLDPNLQLVIKGAIVIAAVAVDVWFHRCRTS